MTDYGKRSPIGSTLCPKRCYICHHYLVCTFDFLARQEKLLQGLMSEIVRMTTQQQPLEVGIPLYPFSHARVFAKSVGSDEDGGHVPLAPLPLSPSFEETISQTHSSPAQSNRTPSTDGRAWISR